MVIADGFGRGVEFVACKGTPTSKQVLDILFHRIIRGHRVVPRYVRSDAGSIFISELCQEFWDVYRTELRHSTAEHHSTAGLAERANATLHDLLIAHRLSSGDDRWYLYLGHFEIQFNELENSVTGYSPTYIEFGRDHRMPLDIAYFGLHSQKRPVSTYVMEHVTHIHEVWDTIRAKLGLNALARKREADAHRDTHLQFEVHDRVLLRRRPGHPKWEEPYHGPYRVSEVLPNDNYKLRDLHSRRLLDVVHVERLVPYPSLTNHGDEHLDVDDEYVQSIVGRKSHPGGEGYLYKVRWRGQDRREDSWLSLEELANCHDMIREYNTIVNPLPNPPPALAREPTFAETPLPTPTPDRHSHFRQHPDRSRPEQRNTDSESGSEVVQPATADPLIDPAISPSALVFKADRVLDVRARGGGHQAKMAWVDSPWLSVAVLAPRWQTVVIQTLQEQRPDLTHLESRYPGPCTWDEVASVLEVRMGPSVPEARVAWLPSWVPLHSVGNEHKQAAERLIDARAVATAQTIVEVPADSPASQQAARVIQIATRRFLASKPPTWPRDPSAPTGSSSINAVRPLGNTHAVRVRRGKAYVWTPYDHLPLSVRRLADRFMSQHGVSAAS